MPTRLLPILLLSVHVPTYRAGVGSCPTCHVTRYQKTGGIGMPQCTTPGVDFGCYPDENKMWIKAPCGGLFRHMAGHMDGPLRCDSRDFKPASGQTILNCTCSPGRRNLKEQDSEPKHCGAHASVDEMGGVSSAYKRLPMPPEANPSVKCCRNSLDDGGDSTMQSHPSEKSCMNK